MHNSSLSFIDAHVEDNEAEVSYIQKFLQQKQIELSEMQKFLLQEFKDMETWKDQRESLLAIFAHSIKDLLCQMKQFCLLFKQQAKRMLTLTIKETAAGFTSILQTKESIIRSQQQQINLLRSEINQQMTRSQNSFLDPKKQSSQRSILSRSIVLQNYNGRSKSRQNLIRFPIGNESLGLRKSPSTTKQLMRQVQKNLKEDYENIRNGYGNDHKKYVKEKIQLLKTRNSGIFYENSIKRF